MNNVTGQHRDFEPWLPETVCQDVTHGCICMTYVALGKFLISLYASLYSSEECR